MASYYEDHGIETPNAATAQTSAGARLAENPALARFFTAVSGDLTRDAASFSTLASALQDVSQEGNTLVRDMIETLLSEAESGHAETQGVDQQFLDTLERVPKNVLQKDGDAMCPICSVQFLEDKYPLVVALACKHRFDMDCISPWLKLHTTCPL